MKKINTSYTRAQTSGDAIATNACLIRDVSSEVAVCMGELWNCIKWVTYTTNNYNEISNIEPKSTLTKFILFFVYCKIKRNYSQNDRWKHTYKCYEKPLRGTLLN